MRSTEGHRFASTKPANPATLRDTENRQRDDNSSGERPIMFRCSDSSVRRRNAVRDLSTGDRLDRQVIDFAAGVPVREFLSRRRA